MEFWIAVVAGLVSVVSLLTTVVVTVMHYAGTRSDVRNLGTTQEEHGRRIMAIEARETLRDATMHRMDKNIALICQKMGVTVPE
jgi:hypothetical protein